MGWDFRQLDRLATKSRGRAWLASPVGGFMLGRLVMGRGSYKHLDDEARVGRFQRLQGVVRSGARFTGVLAKYPIGWPGHLSETPTRPTHLDESPGATHHSHKNRSGRACDATLVHRSQLPDWLFGNIVSRPMHSVVILATLPPMIPTQHDFIYHRGNGSLIDKSRMPAVLLVAWQGSFCSLGSKCYSARLPRRDGFMPCRNTSLLRAFLTRSGHLSKGEYRDEIHKVR
jgi:hypothetical protein